MSLVAISKKLSTYKIHISIDRSSQSSSKERRVLFTINPPEAEVKQNLSWEIGSTRHFSKVLRVSLPEHGFRIYWGSGDFKTMNCCIEQWVYILRLKYTIPCYSLQNLPYLIYCTKSFFLDDRHIDVYIIATYFLWHSALCSEFMCYRYNLRINCKFHLQSIIFVK